MEYIMEKKPGAAALFVLITVAAFLFSSCPEPASASNADVDLRGSVKISPNPAVTGAELTAVYDGTENISYQWKKNSVNVGENSWKFTPAEEGSYTVTVSCKGYNSKTSPPVSVVNGGTGLALSGTVSISPDSAGTGALLTAAYTGEEAVAYQWKRDGISIGANSNLFTADTAGTYTVTVSKFGYNPITSNAASIYRPNGGTPIIANSYTADPSARVWSDGRLYLYPSRDISPVTGYDYSRMDGYHVYSTGNMADWVDHGEILRRDNLPVSAVGSAADAAWGPHYADAMFMWAPDAAYNPSVSGGKYFFYFPHALGGIGTAPSWEDSWTIGVAASSSPCGGFSGSAVRLMDSSGGYVFGGRGLSSPCVFRDGDDYYLITGGGGEFRIAKLKPNMVELAEPLAPYAQMSELQHFKEGPWMFEREGTYYLMYSGSVSGGNGDELLYATGSSPQGPWAYRGIILDPAGTGDSSHGSIVQFNGKWYLFYHNSRLSAGNGALRSVCASELSFNADGSIQKVIQTGALAAKNGPALDTADLNSKFGAGKYTVLMNYDENLSSRHPGFAFVKNIGAADASVIPYLANKGTNDIPSGAIHNLHLAGSYVDFTQVPGNGGKALIRLSYAIAGSGSIQITVNGTAVSPLSLQNSGGWAALADSDPVLINHLNPGNTNTIRLSGLGVNIASMSIYWEM